MTAAMQIIHSGATVDAFPLGRPDDGRERFSMTPTQGAVYRYLVSYHDENGYLPTMRRVQDQFGLKAHPPVFHIFKALQERGWLTKRGSMYHLVEPVMRFEGPREIPFQ